MAADLPAAEAPFDAAQVWRAVGETRMALELVGSRFTDVAGAPPLLKLADSICAGGVVLGDRISVDDPETLGSTRARLHFDGVEVDRGVATACPAGSPLAALTWLANHLASRGKQLRAGDVVISGKICAAPGISPYQRVSATFEGHGSIESFFLP
ncbi:Hypothetical Protein FCC1311_062001 [Hondaea fermentalgiana]|uniref:2-keto-4-pentenoate hydratase n=1 Tax=Hondaea fermentalgiana TaxID=2315210 RepID=A0A2R5G0C7_9STRA|nr:Hypothetical Protein FCC1311_062001 [Hondaea fermentalgiana]|eukprot:GBG24477.1 Hypothetical Protein FCC1311_062001 [Hondaea fermentalgiana]